VDNCLGSKCPAYQECHVVKARRAAQESDLVVVNHHLLLADLAMKEEGFIEFAEAIILDEAHQIPDLAAQFFGISLGSRELERLFDELRGATMPVSQAELQRRIDKAQTALKVLRADAPRDEGRHELSAILPDIQKPLDDLRNGLQKLQQGVSKLADASIEIDKLHEQLLGVIERLSQLASDDTWDGLRWLDVNPRSIRLHLTPLDVADTLRGLIDNGHQSWVFTSATLAIGEDFSHYAERI
jgi:ATP-dependent DNA helicase DinG